MRYRRADGEDAAAIAAVHVATWRVAYRGIIPDPYLEGLSVASRADVWRTIISASITPASEVVVACDDDADICGFVHFSPSRDDDVGPDVGEVTAIYVQPDRAGEGVGSELLRRAETSLAAAGFRTASLWVLDENTRARQFYERAGWMTDGTTKTDERGAVTLREVRYRRNLLQS